MSLSGLHEAFGGLSESDQAYNVAFFVIEKYINAQFNHYDKLHKVKDSIKFFTVLIY